MRWLTYRALDAVLPGKPGCPGLLEAPSASRVIDEFRSAAPFEMRLVLNLSVILWLISPIATVFVPLPAVLLPRALRHRHTDRLTTTRFYLIRQLGLMLKQVAGLAWGQDATVRAYYGFPAYGEDSGAFRETL